MKKKSLILYLTFLLDMMFCLQLHAQEPLTRNMLLLSNVNTDDGLSSARVYSIVEADDGAMWFSTKRGVDRYNGQHVKNYVLPTEMQFSDASGRNIKLTKDDRQNIYAYDNKGKVYLYNKERDCFQLQFNLTKVLGGSVVLNELLVDANGRFWMALDRGVFVLSSRMKGQYILKNTYVNHINFIDKQLLIGTSAGVFVYSPSHARLRLVLRGYSVLSSFHDVAAHQIWLGTFHHGILLLDDRTWKLREGKTILNLSAANGLSLSALPHIPVRSIIPFNSTTILIAVDGAGVYAYDKKINKISLLLNTDGRPENVLLGNGVYALCKDRFGDLWIGSYTGGVDLAIPMVHTLEFVRHEYLNSQSLINNGVNDVLQSVNTQGYHKLWYATDRGVSIYDEQTQRWCHALYNKVALTLCQTSDGNILVGTYGDGVYLVNPDGSSRQVYSVKNGKLKTDYVYSIFYDSNGGLWIGCLDGDMAYFPSFGENHTRVNNLVIYLPIKEVQCIAESPDKKNIAVGTTHGCYLVNKRTRRVNYFFYPEKYLHTDLNFFVNALTYQDARHIWIATDGGGLYNYELHTNQLEKYTMAQSLPSNTVCALVKSPDGKLWMSTDKGLAFIDKGKVTNLNFFKGLEREYKRMAVVRTNDGRIIFGSSEGAVVLAPKFAKGLNYSAPLHLVDILVEGKNFENESQRQEWNAHLFDMVQRGRINLSHSENTFVVRFESINYQYQHDIQYLYYLEGYDHQWSFPSSGQTARYTNLPPGSYTLHIKAIGRSNRRILGEKMLEISIAQPWWNSWWAWIIYLSILGGIVYLGWNYYKERLHRKYYDEKINFFVNTAHNIRTPLSLVLAPLADLAKNTSLDEKNRNFLRMAQRNGDKLLKMVTDLLDFQKIDITKKAVHWQQIELSVLLHQQVDKFLVAANEKHIHLGIADCPPCSFSTDLSMMELIFENLLSNAVKYTENGGNVTVSASVDEVDKQVTIQVSDTGIGIPQLESKHIFQSFFRASNAVNSHEMGSGLGLMLTKQLVQKLGGKLTFDSEEGKGTTFTLALPKLSMSPERLVSSDKTERHDEDSGNRKDTLLFVDDNEDLRQYIRMAFSDTYQVVTVESGEAALRYLKENGECDIVVSDVMMPGMQGDELCRQIKENKDTSWLPVILLTAKVGRDFMVEGLGLGADDYIAKPFDVVVLASKIDSMLKNRRRMSRYYLERSLALVRNEASTASVEPVPSKEEEVNPLDQAFVEKATRLVLDHLDDTDFNIDSLCREMAMSRTLFYGKLKTLIGKSPQDFMRLIRLEQAAKYLKQGESVLDVSVKTGFVNVKYFSTVFKKYFGVSPSKYK